MGARGWGVWAWAGFGLESEGWGRGDDDHHRSTYFPTHLHGRKKGEGRAETPFLGATAMSPFSRSSSATLGLGLSSGLGMGMGTRWSGCGSGKGKERLCVCGVKSAQTSAFQCKVARKTAPRSPPPHTHFIATASSPSASPAPPSHSPVFPLDHRSHI